MGEAKDLVGAAPKEQYPPEGLKTVHRPRISSSGGGILKDLTETMDTLDRAIEVKEHDLEVEGRVSKGENHFKLGMLRGAAALIRRAKALLEDYGMDLKDDIDPNSDLPVDDLTGDKLKG